MAGTRVRRRIDWIVGGHEHVYPARTIGETPITKADADARTALRIDVDRAAGKIAASARRVDLDNRDPRPRHGAPGGDLARATRARPAGEDRADAPRRGRDQRTSPRGNRAGDPRPRDRARRFPLRHPARRLGTEVAFVNGGAIRVNDDVPAGGDVRVYELEGIFYYDDRPVVFELTGRELLALLAKSVSQADLGHGRFLQVSGLRFRYHVSPGRRRGWTPATSRSRPDATAVRAARARPALPRGDPRLPLAQRLPRRLPIFSLGDGGTSPAALERPARAGGSSPTALSALPDRRIITDLDGRIVRIDAP